MTDIYEQEDELVTTASGVTISYTASLVRQGKHRFYTLTMPSEVLAQNCTVGARSFIQMGPIAFLNDRAA
jgi:hypothetical protein